MLTFFGVVSLLPLLCGRKLAVHQYGLFSVLALLSFLSSFIAFIFTIAVWGTAHTRFRQAGYDASFGPLVRFPSTHTPCSTLPGFIEC